MDIWKWVFDTERDLREAGNNRLADLIESIPTNTQENRPELVEAAMPEALAGARAIKNQWLEVYFRHWGINNRMSDMIEGEKALPEIVSLLEFSHRDETVTCPQSVCATQDIAMCYGNMDGPGWVDERLAVAQEALARINPEWPCFSCISEEYVQALLDANRSAEAIQFLQKQEQALLEVGEESPERFVKLYIRALCLEGNHAEALTRLDAFEAKEDNDLSIGQQQSLDISRAILLTQLQQYKAAWEILPNWSDLKPTAYPEWAQTVLSIATADAQYNHWQIGRSLQKSVDYLSSVGAHHHTVNVGIAHIQLALARNAHWTAQRAMLIAHKHLAKLRKPQAPTKILASLSQQMAESAPSAINLPVPANELASYIRNQDNTSPEHDVQYLLQACTLLPQDGDLASLTASALAACGATDEAKNHLLSFVRANPTEDGPNYELVGRMLDAQDFAGIQQLAREIEAVNPSAALWFKAQASYAQKHYQDACLHASAYVAINPEAKGARDLWATAALAQQDLSTALQLRQTLVTLSPPDSEELINQLWTLLTVASAAQDWSVVRDTASELGFKLDAPVDETGIIDEDWGPVYIEFKDKHGSQTYYAYRTGPATARILSHKNAPDVQRLNDWVAFNTTLVEPMPEDEIERKNFISTFRVEHVITAGGFANSVFCDGAYPGDEAFEAFAQSLNEQGWQLYVTSDEDYTVSNPNATNDERIAGCHFQVAAPGTLSDRAINDTLLTLTAKWQHPICWPRFADRVGLDTTRHMHIVEQYGL